MVSIDTQVQVIRSCVDVPMLRVRIASLQEAPVQIATALLCFSVLNRAVPADVRGQQTSTGSSNHFPWLVISA
jgi:hypothetical protein